MLWLQWLAVASTVIVPYTMMGCSPIRKSIGGPTSIVLGLFRPSPLVVGQLEALRQDPRLDDGQVRSGDGAQGESGHGL